MWVWSAGVHVRPEKTGNKTQQACSDTAQRRLGWYRMQHWSQWRHVTCKSTCWFNDEQLVRQIETCGACLVQIKLTTRGTASCGQTSGQSAARQNTPLLLRCFKSSSAVMAESFCVKPPHRPRNNWTVFAASTQKHSRTKRELHSWSSLLSFEHFLIEVVI